MDFFLFIPDYFRWHYSRSLRDLWGISARLVGFIPSYFSIGFLLRTLFSPWRRLHEDYERGFNLESFFSSLIVNVVMRVVGFSARLITILAGLFATAGAAIAVVLLFLLWILFPLIIAFFFTLGLLKLFS